jgi:hypothetical protein
MSGPGETTGLEGDFQGSPLTISERIGRERDTGVASDDAVEALPFSDKSADVPEPLAPGELLVSKLRSLKDPPRDPEALARAIDHRCGQDIGFGLYKYDPAYADLRRGVLEDLREIQKKARALLSPQGGSDPVYPFVLTIDDLISDQVSFEQRERLKPQLLAAVAMLAELPLRSNLEAFRGRRHLDERVTEVVRAVGDYWLSTEDTPFGGGFHRQPGSPVFGVTDRSSASLVEGVMSVLGIPVTTSELETHLGKAAADDG